MKATAWDLGRTVQSRALGVVISHGDTAPLMSEPASTRPEGGEPPEREDEGRRCHVTLLFSDVCDYTTLAEQLDPEDAYRLRRYVEQLVTGVIRKHGVATEQRLA